MNQYNRRFGSPYGMRPNCSCETECPFSRTREGGHPSQGTANGCDAHAYGAPSLAMAYIPYQAFENLYDPQKALQNGTIFEDLNFVFCGSSFVCPQNGR